MIDCSKLIHPFQNDPGVSQADRIMNELLAGAPDIDARSLADLLDYFTQIAPDINYYDINLAITDWKPFFQNSLPFLLASIIKTKTDVIDEKFNCYNNLMLKNPSQSGLQLNLFYIYYNIFKKINTWHLQIKNSKLPIELFIEKLIKNKLKQPLIAFASITNAAVKYYCVKKIDFTDIISNPIWGIQAKDLFPIDNTFLTSHSNRKRLIALQSKLSELFPVLLEALKTLPLAAEGDLQTSLLMSQNVDLQKKHEPHLALIFVFLSMFQKLQSDLNGFTKKHLDFFYQNVLQLQPQGAVPDKANILIQLQNQVQKYYLVTKGTLVKDGKDNNKQEILFSLDDDIVVNKTKVTSVKILFLNNQILQEKAYLEGVYMATDATKADGVSKDFDDDQPKNYPTVGAEESKYIAPGTDFFQPYPNARLGFILASSVLLLNEGRRTVNITIACQLSDPTNTNQTGQVCQSSDPTGDYPESYSTQVIFKKIQRLFKKNFIYVSMDLINQAEAKGISENTIQLLKDKFLFDKTKTICGQSQSIYLQEDSVTWETWWSNYYSTINTVNPLEKTVIDELFPKQRVFKILFSGAKDWIEPSQIKRMRFTPLTVRADGVTMTFAIKMKAIIKTDKPAITFYDKSNFTEDFNTTKPLVKIELNDFIKIKRGVDLDASHCCLDVPVDNSKIPLSFYYFFRNLKIIQTADKNIHNAIFSTAIDVKVCGLKNFIVQNDESLQDVNSPINPFGTLPKINADFYIGSTEVFCKNWQQVIVNLFWKDKPMSLKSYYHGYEDKIYNITSESFDDSRFKFSSAVLNDNKWFDNANERQLFQTDYNSPCSSYPFVSSVCGDLNKMFNSDGWVKRICINPDFINTDCILPACIASDGSILSSSIDTNNTVLATAFKPEFIETVGPYDYINYICIKEGRYSYIFKNTDFTSLDAENKDVSFFNNESFTASSGNGFIRLTLLGQDFQHSRYSYVLTRQMLALGKFPAVYIGPVYDGIDPTGATTVSVISFDDLFKTIADSLLLTEEVGPRLNAIIGAIRAAYELAYPGLYPGSSPVTIPFDVSFDNSLTGDALGSPHRGYSIPPGYIIDGTVIPSTFKNVDLDKIIQYLHDTVLTNTETQITKIQQIRVVIPNAPYTIQIQGITLDYTATAGVQDIDLIHLYPYDGTYKAEEIQLQPTLFPTFCDEGTLFLGLQDLIPGENVNILFQLAEATSDSESDPQDIFWYFLANNTWQQLRNQFEVLSDATDNLTTSGIIKFSLPENISSDNTIMPAGSFWIKAAIPKNSGDVSETIGIFTQAISVTFTNDDANDKLRLNTPLPAGSISKLDTADANIKEIDQPYDSFGGAVPEVQMQYYVRVSELLRHKGRAIQKFDYERLALQAFPQVFKAKCINHSFGLNAHEYVNDFPFAPGYVLLAVIPDLNQLKAGNSFQPTVPVSVLEKIEQYLQTRTSPFVRFRAMNPRYEAVDFFITVKLQPGKDKNFYKALLAEAIRDFMAPWAVGDYYKLTFGQCVSRSDIIQFLETRDYVDYIQGLKMLREDDLDDSCQEPLQICPATPRSILIAGDIDVCIIDGCEEWGKDKCSNVPIPLNDYCKEKVKS